MAMGLSAAGMLACTTATDEPEAHFGRSEEGGVLDVVVTDLGFDRRLDPSAEYTSSAFALYSNLLLRPLMNYRHVSGERGNVVLPDLAEGMPEISEDGTTYTFRLRDGVRFGPPLDREITSSDVAYAFERMMDDSVDAQYSFYFETAIEGLTDYGSGLAETISGIETPDDDTIVFHLIEPTGDFLYRLAMPAAAPIPEEVAGCFEERSAYGNHLIASGPYVLAGSEDLDVSSCDTMAPISGYVAEERLSLVRNPNHDPATENPGLVSAAIEGLEMTVVPDPRRIADGIESGSVDYTTAAPTLETLRRYASIRRLRDNLHIESGDRTWYISMNLTQPPFDDVHVRRAANYVMDKDSLVRAWGGPIQGEVATHILPDNMLNGALADFDPYESRNHAGNLRAARDEMRLSRYDTNGDGSCDADVCKGVEHLSQPQTPWSSMTPVIESSFAKIGIGIETNEATEPYERLQSVPNDIPISSVPGWVKDYPDPFSFIGFLFDGRNIRNGTNTNYSFVGLTEDRAVREGMRYPFDGVPSIDEEIDLCSAITDSDDRRSCWADLDRTLMEDVVPWIPYLDANHLLIVSDNVTRYEYDQYSGELSYAHVRVRR